jgi:hypothetical protein
VIVLLLMQGGQETDFILVSCSGAGISSDGREKILRAKQVCFVQYALITFLRQFVLRNYSS